MRAPQASISKPSAGAAASNPAREPKKRGLSRYGPPCSGQNVSQLPHSLQKSANSAHCSSRVTWKRTGRRRIPPPSIASASVSSATVPLRTEKNASLGQHTTQALQDSQSNHWSRRSIRRGRARCRTAW